MTTTPADAKMKHLSGINSTPELRSVISDVLKLPQAESATDDSQKDQDVESSARSRALLPLPVEKAKKILIEQSDKKDGTSIPISAVIAMKTLMSKSTGSAESISSLQVKLENAISQSRLSFAQPTPEGPVDAAEAARKKKFEKRLERLRMKVDEDRYRRLTGNLDLTKPDDVTVRSMTYAASVGLNMIVAPISFGVFMYFFAGQIFHWIAGEDKDFDPRESAANKTDIRRVIAGVVSGVGMLFIEMILFVIRSHELDASIRKKQKKSTPNPFGYTKEREQKTFQ